MTASPLLLAATTALLFFTTFHVKQQGKDGERPKPVEHAVCTKESCLKAAGAILDKLDQTVHPCKDFYQFACGNYIRRTILPENMDVMSVIQSMEDEVLMIIFRALESPTLYRTGGSLIKAKMLYETCMNSDTLEDDSVQVLRLFLSERGVGHWPVLDADWSSGDMNLEWRLAMLFVHHTPVFFHMYADAPSFTSEYILNIYPASSPLGAKEVTGADRERIFEAYHKLLIETLRLLGVPEVRVQADSFDIIGFELQFSMITNISQQCLVKSNKERNETMEDDSRLYNITVDDLEYHIPQIKWSRLMSYVFRNLGLPLDSSSLYVLVHCKEYFRQLGTLLSNTPPRTLANYMSWKFVLSYMSFMSMPFRQIFQDYTLLTPELKHSKLKTYTSRWKGCVSLVGSWFGNAIAAYYARHGYPTEVEQKAKQLVSSLKATFIDIISNTAWLDEESQNATIEKVLSMKTEVGYPRHMLSADYVETFYAKLELSTDSLLKNMLKMSRFLVYNELQKLNRPVEDNRLLVDNIYKGPLQGNAHYFATKNALVVPMGILRPPIFDLENPEYLNYGRLGTEIAHEMAHGFENIGLQYDKEGRESLWWSEEMKNKFWMKAKCFVEQYNRYVIDAVEEKNVDGQRTLHENIADSAGLKKAFMSYQRYVKEHGKEPKLPGMEFTNQQLFFISFAQMKCEVRNKEGYEEYIADSTSSLLQTPFRYRVNGALANSEFFAAVFKCPSGSPMSHTKRCSIW
ncbi:unnamed protein product [Larinioides sclopetarius]|uniref:Uncharacterized protein n=1 Tax=Larinioides sclopetarius TaxID=280406 RepID=A0AAV2B051_9ARAC